MFLLINFSLKLFIFEVIYFVFFGYFAKDARRVTDSDDVGRNIFCDDRPPRL